MPTFNPQSPGTGAQITGGGAGPEIMAAAILEGNEVISADGEHVGKISDIMFDVRSGHIVYDVLSEGGFPGMGNRPHAIPWSALTRDTAEKCFRVDLPAQALKNDPGFVVQKDWNHKNSHSSNQRLATQCLSKFAARRRAISPKRPVCRR